MNRVLYWLPLFEPLFDVGRSLGEQNQPLPKASHQARNHGRRDPAEPLENLRFADDLLLIAQSMSDTRKMLADLREEASK